MSKKIANADAEGLARAVEIIRRGGVVVYPTETVYGIGCDPSAESAVARVRQIKGRDSDRPMLAVTHEWHRVLPWLLTVPNAFGPLMSIEPPLAITMVFEASEEAPAPLVTAEGTIAIRRTSDVIARHLAAASGGALLSTSANRSEQPPPDHFTEIDPGIAEEVDLVLNAGRKLAGRPSTVIAAGDAGMEFIREGAVLRDRVMRLIESE